LFGLARIERRHQRARGEDQDAGAKSNSRFSADGSRFTLTPASPLRHFLEQLPADQHATDFAGAGADLVELGVTQQPSVG
jgi:hypothetical protein